MLLMEEGVFCPSVIVWVHLNEVKDPPALTFIPRFHSSWARESSKWPLRLPSIFFLFSFVAVTQKPIEERRESALEYISSSSPYIGTKGLCDVNEGLNWVEKRLKWLEEKWNQTRQAVEVTAAAGRGLFSFRVKGSNMWTFWKQSGNAGNNTFSPDFFVPNALLGEYLVTG